MQNNSAQKLKELRTFRRRKGLSQAFLAKTLGISQSTVSRRERKPPQRHSDATYKLCTYAIKKTEKTKSIDRKAIRKAIDEILARSDAHAIALSEIIDAIAELSRSDEGELG